VTGGRIVRRLAELDRGFGDTDAKLRNVAWIAAQRTEAGSICRRCTHAITNNTASLIV
jgi:hypothetical protein